MKDNFIKELESTSPALIAQRWVIDRTPHIFGNDQKGYVDWKSQLASKIEVDGRAITIIGSACVGFSLSPLKNLRDFDDSSDIDIAIISAYHFDVAWRCVRSFGPKVHSLSNKQRASLEDHKKRLIYWGTFDTKHLLPKLPFGKKWFEAFEKMTTIAPTQDRDINARVYRDFESLSAYHTNNIKKLREIATAGNDDD
ncbi:hypothetical protein [Thioalkalivibrio sulfidiphilus]|uniref:hypothetical protein n=1 Tax=Thioalkalivibrio sulfidiphilus TaxID=1033854 RepID=UPI00035DED32|nr:hypothetical protein [Thioalkalivibrio sulfidiphilus]